LLAATLLGGTRASVVAPAAYTPDYTLDLRGFGYEEPTEKWARLHMGPRNSVAFVGDDTVAVSLFVRNPKPVLSVRDRKFGGPYIFQTTFVDARSRKVLRTQQWSNSSTNCGLFPTANGGFIVWHDLELSLHAPDGTAVRVLSLDPKRFPQAVSIAQSPSGNSLFARRSDRSGDHVLVIRSVDLQEVTGLELPGYFDGAGSDANFAFLRPHPNSGIPPRMDVFIRAIAGDSGFAMPDRIYTTSAAGCGSITFIDDRTLGVSGGCHELTIISTAGEVIYQHLFDKVFSGSIHPCRNCNLLVSGTYVLAGGSALLDISPKSKGRSVLLFDRRTAQLTELPRAGQVKYFGATALSPDGCLLAIQNDWRVVIYRMCSLRGSTLTSP